MDPAQSTFGIPSTTNFLISSTQFSQAPQSSENTGRDNSRLSAVEIQYKTVLANLMSAYIQGRGSACTCIDDDSVPKNGHETIGYIENPKPQAVEGHDATILSRSETRPYYADEVGILDSLQAGSLQSQDAISGWPNTQAESTCNGLVRIGKRLHQLNDI